MCVWVGRAVCWRMFQGDEQPMISEARPQIRRITPDPGWVLAYSCSPKQVSYTSVSVSTPLPLSASLAISFSLCISLFQVICPSFTHAHAHMQRHTNTHTHARTGTEGEKCVYVCVSVPPSLSCLCSTLSPTFNPGPPQLMP